MSALSVSHTLPLELNDMTTPEVNDTWQLLPKTPDAAMVQAGSDALARGFLPTDTAVHAVWSAMAEAAPAPRWSATPPTEQGWYWHWNGDEDSAPIPTSVLYSGFRQACFVSAGQLGITEAVFCAEYGGLWLPLSEPAVLGPHDKWS